MEAKDLIYLALKANGADFVQQALVRAAEISFTSPKYDINFLADFKSTSELPLLTVRSSNNLSEIPATPLWPVVMYGL